MQMRVSLTKLTYFVLHRKRFRLEGQLINGDDTGRILCGNCLLKHPRSNRRDEKMTKKK